MIIGRLHIQARRWPWQLRVSQPALSRLVGDPREAVGQPWGWRPTAGMGRFGGGWNWKLGIAIGGRSVSLDLLFGNITFNWKERS